jgi:uncharacterized phiE125 gp8 family phage protein
MLTPLAPFDGDTILPLADARVQLRLTADDTFHDDAVTSARDAAIGWAEDYTGRSLQERDFIWTTNQFTPILTLPIGPATSVELSYYDGDGTDLTIDAEDFYLGNDKVSPAINSAWPYADGRPGGVRIVITAGYSTADDIPPHLLAAVKLAMTAFFENRTDPDLTGAMRVADQFRAVL